MHKNMDDIYLKSSHGDDEVITFGKSPELERLDLQGGVARIGGPWRGPSYAKSYLRAARILLKQALETNDLDQLGLPLFYLHRHSLELFMKGMLQLLFEIAKMRIKLSRSGEKLWSPSGDDQKILTGEHNLATLYETLEGSGRLLGFEDPLPILKNLVKALTKIETHPSWSRYARAKGENSKPYLIREVIIPSRDLHAALEEVFSKVGWRLDGDEETYETKIYHHWNDLQMRSQEDS